MSPLEPEESKGVYHPAAPAALTSGFMAVRTGPNPAAAAPKLRAIAASADPDLLLYDMKPLDKADESEQRLDKAFYLFVGFAIFFIVFLSAAVTFALMSFTVSQRTREIGIRKALGAGIRPILSSVFGRAFCQLALGAALGALLAFAAFSRIPDSHIAKPPMILAVAAFLFFTGFLACVGPVLRVLRIPPTIAMKEEN